MHEWKPRASALPPGETGPPPLSPLDLITRSIRQVRAGWREASERQGMIYLADKSIPPPPACATSVGRVLLLLSLRAGRPFSLLRSLHECGGRFWWKRCLFPAPQSDINQQNSETHAELLLPSRCRRRRRRCPTALLRQLTHVRGVSCRRRAYTYLCARESALAPPCLNAAAGPGATSLRLVSVRSSVLLLRGRSVRPIVRSRDARSTPSFLLLSPAYALDFCTKTPPVKCGSGHLWCSPCWRSWPSPNWPRKAAGTEEDMDPSGGEC